MTNKKQISTQIEEVKPTGSIRTKKPSTVSIAVDHRMATELSDLFMDFKEGHKREKGLVGIELYAIYENGEEEKAPGDESEQKELEG